MGSGCVEATLVISMIIGIVVNVLEEEHQQQAKAKARAAGEPTLIELREEIRALGRLIEAREKS